MSESRGEYATDDTEPVPLLGSVTGYAKEVVRNIRRAAISAQLKDFLLEVYARSFGNAGYQRREGRENPGGACAFDNAAWAHEFGIQRQHMYRLRVRAVELGILSYDEETSWLRWNLAFEEWQPLDSEYRRQRYSRPGAGAKAGKSNRLRTVASENISNGLRSPDENKSNGLRQSGIDLIKRVTPDCLESAAEAARGGSLRKGYEERDTKKKNDADASCAADADASSLPPAPLARVSAKSVRKLTDEQLVAHREEAAYIASVLTLYKTVLRMKQLPAEKQQRAGARWFYTARDGQCVPPEEVMDWYRLTKSQPFWQGTFLSLVSLEKPFTEHAGDLTAYRTTISEKGATRHETRSNARRGAGALPGANGHQPTPAKTATGQPTWAPGEDAATTRARHGRYAAFVDTD